MGAWGTGVFSDDFACDVREAYRDAIIAGLTASAAEEQVIAALACDGHDGIEASTFWIALGLAEHEVGRLSDATRERAIAAIDTEDNLRAFRDLLDGDAQDAALLQARERALQTARATLLKPQPKPKKLRGRRPPPYTAISWEVGRLYAFRGMRNVAVLQVVEVRDAQALGGDYLKIKDPAFVGEPVVAVMDYWSSETPRSQACNDLQHARRFALAPTGEAYPDEPVRFAPFLQKQADFNPECIVPLGVTLALPELRDVFGNMNPNWAHLEDYLESIFAADDDGDLDFEIEILGQ